MKAKTFPCPVCNIRMKRKYSYKKAFWKCSIYGERVVYECPNCKGRIALIIMDEIGYNAYITELQQYFQHESEQASNLRILLNNYREKANTAKLNMELDALEKAMNRLRERLKRM